MPPEQPSPFPVRGVPTSAADISFPREKPRWLALSLSYRIVRILKAILGERRLVRLFLNLHWIAWRFSYELTHELIGKPFRNHTYCTSREVLERWVPAGSSILDIGCGTGRLCQLAAPIASRVLGVDYDSGLIGEANRENPFPHVEFRVADVTDDFVDERFDVVLLVAVLEHIQDVDEILSSIRAISPRLIVEVPDFDADPFEPGAA